MNPTLETIKKGQEEFDKKFGELDLDPESRGLCNNIKHWHTSFLISLFEGERERLISELKEEKKFKRYEGWDTTIVAVEAFTEGHNKAINNQIKHYQEIIDYLKSIV